MGLLLSVLVTCVGVIELITFYSNISRNLTLRPVHGDLTTVRENYIDDLHNLRKRIAIDLQKLQSQPDSRLLEKDNSRDIQRYTPTLRLNSDEDIEIEFNEQVLLTPRPISPRTLLVTEKTETSFHRTPSPRRFVVSEEPQGLQKSKHQISLPDYLIEEQEKSSRSPNHPRNVLREEGTSSFPFPLSSQFVVTEKDQNNLYEFSSKINCEVQDLTSSFSENLVYSNEEHRRPPSPYPVLEIPHVPRNSIVNDLVNDPVVSVSEADEEFCGSRSPSPYKISKIILEDVPPNLKLSSIINNEKRSVHNTSPKRFRSKSESEKSGFNAPAQDKKTTTNNQARDKDNENESYGSFEVLELVDSEQAADNEEYLDCLDGVSKQKCSKRNKKTIKKKYSASNSVENASCSTRENTNETKGTTEVLTDAARELENVQNYQETKDSRQNEERQLSEPFWVKY